MRSCESEVLQGELSPVRLLVIKFPIEEGMDGGSLNLARPEVSPPKSKQGENMLTTYRGGRYCYATGQFL